MKVRAAVATSLAAVLVATVIYSDRTSPAPGAGRALSAELTAATDAITRGPYLQMGTPSSVVVRWRTNNPTNSQVVYGPDPANLIWTASLAALTTEHEVALSGLMPLTKYYYAVGSIAQRLAGGDANHSFVTSPLPGTAVPTRIWVLGDSGTADANAAAVRNAYYGFGGPTAPNLWLMLGDNAYNDGLDSEYQAAVFDMYPSTLRQSVLWPTIGNHDIANTAAGTGPYYNIFTLPKNGEAGGLPSGTEAYYAFDYGNIHFICLDSFDVDLTAGSPMMTWLRNDLASTASRWTVAFWHHPPYSKGSHESDVDYELTQMRQNALPLLEAAGVDLVLAGHSHSYERSFLIDGHYGTSNTFTAAMKKDGGSGREEGTGAYRKPATIPSPHAGAVYTVAGSSGFAGGGALNHPAMFVSLNVMGSLVLDVNNGRLDASFVDSASVVRDHFTILKEDPTPPLALTTTSVPGGIVGTPYSAPLAATGGVPPYTWSIAAGTLPGGLTLNAATGAIAGTPTTPETAVFTVRVRDSSAPQLIAERQFSLATATASIVVPDVRNLTQAAAATALTNAGLAVGTVSSASSPTVPAGSVISQSPAAGSQWPAGTAVDLVVSTGIAPVGVPIVVGTQIAGTFADATGHSAQSHLVYAANAGVWWLFTLTSDADSDLTNHSVQAYRSSGPNLATATWIAAGPSPEVSTDASISCGSCLMGSGRALSVAYVNNAPADAVHVEIAMAADGQNGLTGHIRATVTATSINWESWNYHDEHTATWSMPHGTALGISTGKFIHSGGPILQQEVDANARVSSRPDTGSTWSSGFSNVSVIDNSMLHASNAIAFAPLANDSMLAVYDNGGGVSPCYQCGGVGVPEPNLSNLGFKKSNADGSWPTVAVGGQDAGDGQVFSTDATIDQNDWALVPGDTATIYAFRSNEAANGVDAAVYSVATNTWAAFTPPPAVGTGQSLKKGAGVFGVASGQKLWLFIVSNDAANSILYTAFNGTAWTQWATVQGTGSGQHARQFISGYPVAVGNQIGLIWTEGTTQNDVVVMGFAADLAPMAPNVVALAQAAAALAIANAGLTVGTVGTAPSASVPIGSVISQSPAGGSLVAAGSPVDLLVSSGVTVPSVVGQTQADASALITAVAGLTMGAITTAPSGTVPAGIVINQSPAGNTNVSGGSSVALVVSAGPAPTLVPNVVNLTQAAATTAIANAGLVVGAIGSASSATVPAGLVISQNPAAAVIVTPGSAVDFVVSTGPVLVAVPNVLNLTQSAASAAITNAGLVVGTVSSASSPTVPAGSVISQTPAATTQVAVGSAVSVVISSGATPPAPVVIGSQIAGTFADATGHSAQSHLVYAANARVWWMFTLTSTADSVGGTNHSVQAYRSSGPDLATATWTAATPSPGASSAGSVNCNSCVMGDGRALSVAYVNNAPTDAVHVEVAMTADGQNGLVGHVRATLTATSISWEAWNYHDEDATTWSRPRGTSLGVSTGKFIHSASSILQQEVHANARTSTRADAGATWTTGFSNVSVIDDTMFHTSNVNAFAPLANNTMLAVYDNGGGTSTCYHCSGGVAEPNLSNLRFKKSNAGGAWPAVAPGSVLGGDGRVFSTDATIDQNDWALVPRDVSTIYAFRSNAAATGIDAAAYSATTNAWAAFTPPPLFGAGKSLKKGAGVFGVANGSNIWLFVVNTDAANSILATTFNGTAWTPWAAIPGTGSGTHLRKYISGYPALVGNQIGVMWTEGATQNDVVVMGVAADLPPVVPNVVNMAQPAATSAIAAAGLIVGTVGSASSATVAAGSVISQNPAGGVQVTPGSAVDLVVSTGPVLVAVPNVVSLTQTAATTAITNAGLVVGTVASATSPTEPAGSVISQNPVAPTQVAAGSAVNLTISSGPPIAVPNVVGLTQAAATAAITNAGLVVGTVTNASSATVPAGSVISQNPVAPTQVAQGSAVNLVVSTGPPLVAVPNVVNLTQAAATTAITNAGLAVGTVTTASSATVPAGSVISQSPVAASQVVAGSAVNFVVSTGPVLVAVPNVVSLTQAAATTAITNAGLVVGTVTNASSATVPAGSVISQNPVAPTQVAQGSAVNLVVSTGPPLVAVPNVVNLTQAAATTAITNAGLVVGTIGSASSPTVPAGSVISQNPVAASQVVAGSAVNFVVSTGPVLVAVPNVVSLTQAAATTAITNAGLVVGTVTNASSATVPSGSVISQTPTAATQVAVGSAVNLVVSTGPAAVSPVVDVVVFSDGSGTRNTSAFSTAVAGEVLLAFAASDGPSPGAQTVTVSGAGLTWTLVRRANTQAGTAEIWQATAAAALTNVTVRSTPSVAGFQQSLTVVAFRGATGVGASAIANGSTGAPSVSLVTTRANSLVYGVGNDWDRAVARTVGTNQVMVHQATVTAVGDTFWVQSRSAAVAIAGSSVQLNDTAPTNDRWNFAGVEIVP